MTIRKTAYNTSATAGILTNNILKNLEAVSISDLHEQPPGVFGVLGRSTFERNIPAFAFPLISTGHDGGAAFIDCRGFGTNDENLGKFNIRDGAGLSSMQLHGALALAWHRGRQSSLQLMSNLPLMIFMSWISESIGKKLHLDGRSQYIVQILAGILYLKNFTDEELTAEDKNHMTMLFTRTFRLGDVDVNSNLINQYGHINDVHDFCTACYEATQSVSLKNLNSSILFSVVGGAMWGPNAMERMCVSLEYPPAWIASVFQVITDQSYRGKCVLSNIAQRGHLKKHVDEFVRACFLNIEQSA